MNEELTMTTVHRRQFLGLAGAATLAGMLPPLAFTAVPGDRKFVFVILRGGLDGLAAVVPHADPNYRDKRQKLALDAAVTLPLAEGFGLHPSLKFMQRSWDAGELAILHAASTPYRERSHFDGQDVLESGATGVFATSDGWLNRALGTLPTSSGVAIANSIPLVLRGAAPATSWAPSFAPPPADDTINRLQDLYAGDPLLGPALASAVDTAALMDEQEGAAPGARARPGRGAGPQAYRLLAASAAKLLGAAGGPCAAVLEFDGWDTHANQGAADGGLAQRLAGLDAALTALRDGLGPRWHDTVVIAASEFGRTVAENGTGGTDHGTGGVAFVLGGAVRGKRMLGDWPGLAAQALYQGRDLAPANDLRLLFASALHGQFGIERSALANTVFPSLKDPIRFPDLIS
jgi:uncharacterized protein (DUF1501 family)